MIVILVAVFFLGLAIGYFLCLLGILDMAQSGKVFIKRHKTGKWYPYNPFVYRGEQ